MNCKPGDLAVIVMAGPKTQHHLGKIVRVVSAHTGRSVKLRDLPHWDYVEPKLKHLDGTEIDWIHDMCLRPIRNNDGEDEMLRITGKPQEISALKRVA